MSAIITDEILDNTLILAKLEMDDNQRMQAKNDMEKMLEYIDRLNELDTEGIDAMSHSFNQVNCFREDIVTNEDDTENILSNAPQKENNMFVVPKTF